MSRDFIGNSYSGRSIFPLTKVVGGNLIKVMVLGYDNEYTAGRVGMDGYHLSRSE